MAFKATEEPRLIQASKLVMTTQFAALIRRRNLRNKAGSLAEDGDRIVSAIDVLIGTG